MKFKIYEVRDDAHNVGLYMVEDFRDLGELFDEGKGITPSSRLRSVKILGDANINRESLERLFDYSRGLENIKTLYKDASIETSSICVCTIPLLQLVGKQTQISCAQEPEHAPGFSLRVLDTESS